jgi:hemerythrin-like domain-containing protein
MTNAIRIIKQQHRAAASVLFAVRAISRKALRSGNPPDFRWLRTLLDYVDRFPERLHQPNEDTFLFRVLLRREPGRARMVARLRRDHAANTGYATRLREALADWERGNPKAGLHSVHVANHFARFVWRHGRFEQRELLPAAQAALSDAEWREVERAFSATGDPLAGSSSRQHCEAALHRFVQPYTA